VHCSHAILLNYVAVTKKYSVTMAVTIFGPLKIRGMNQLWDTARSDTFVLGSFDLLSGSKMIYIIAA